MKAFLAGGDRSVLLLVHQAAGGDQGTKFPPAHSRNSVMGAFELSCRALSWMQIHSLEMTVYIWKLQLTSFPLGPVLTLLTHAAASALLLHQALRNFDVHFNSWRPCKRKEKPILFFHGTILPFLTPAIHSSRQVLLSQQFFLGQLCHSTGLFIGVKMSSPIEECSPAPHFIYQVFLQICFCHDPARV